MISTLQASELSSAEICRRNGWTTGAVLGAPALDKETDRSTRMIRITAVGDAAVLAKELCYTAPNVFHETEEVIIDLHTRDWHRVGRPGIPMF